ncbi:MAG TPA: TlpA disulfide reductase family protein [Myxococcaceae bacterium]|nr:TlpA disulfide reductase family protein [Myxococcaceae bacterium]
MLGCLWLCACVSQGPLPVQPGSSGGSQTPLLLKLPRFPSGEPFDLTAERGHVVLLDVWATWCEPCRDALPVYEALAKQYGSKGLSVYAINVDADAKKIGDFMGSIKVSLPVLIDKDAAAAEYLLHVKEMPTTFILDRQGVVRFTHAGFAEEFLMKYQTEIETLLAEPRS